MNRRSKNLMLLLITISLMCIGAVYALTSAQVELNGTAAMMKHEEWNVHFVEEHCRALNENELKYKNAYMDASGTTGTFYAALTPGEVAKFRVQITNEGHIPAEFYEGHEVPHPENSTNYVTAWQEFDYEFYDSFEDVPYLLNFGAVHTFSVYLECSKDANVTEDLISEKHEIDWQYVQFEGQWW